MRNTVPVLLFLAPPALVLLAWLIRPTPPRPATAAAPSPAAQAPGRPLSDVSRVLRPGDRGPDVAALQHHLGLPPTGHFGAATRAAVQRVQQENRLDPDGVVGRWTLAVLRGHAPFFGYAWHHDPDAFVPRYPLTAFHESGSLRTPDDPYGVGAISDPGQDGDRGGRSYGVYQLPLRTGAIARFVAWPGNPFGPVLTAAGPPGSAAFDQAWRTLARDQNAAFGDAQQAFLEIQRGAEIDRFLAACGAGAAARRDSRLRDLAIGTLNQYGGLSAGIAAQARRRAGPSPSAAAVGLAIQDAKAARVELSFASSPGAWPGLRTRIARERRVFEGS